MSNLRKPIVVLHESFRKFVEKFNVLSNNVGEPLFLKTHNDSDVVTTINEINATFNPFQGKIVYPNDSVPTGAAFSGYDGQGNLIDYPSYTGAQLPNTHLTITTNQHGGQDIDIDAGRDFLVDAVRNINLTGVSFDGDYSGNYVSKVDGTSLDSVGGAMTLTGNSTYNITTKSTFTVQTGLEGGTTASIDLNATGDIYLDAGGDIYLDAGDSDIIFRRHGPSNNFARWQMGTPGDPNNFKLNVGKGDFTVDVAGDIVLDAGDSDILFNRQGVNYVKTRMGVSGGVTYTKQEYPRGSMEIEAANNIIFDAAGDIVLDADGNEFVFRNGTGADSARINLSNSGNFTLTTPAALTLDVAGDINIDAAGDNIRLKDAGTIRQEYTLGATTTIATTGNRTETVTGNVSDSADGTYHIGATGNMDIDTRGTYDVVTGGNFTQTTTGTVGINATQDITLNTNGDIILDAGDSDVIFKRHGTTFARAKMGIEGQPSTFAIASTGGNFHVDAYGDIVLDAGDSDIVFKRNGTTFLRHRMGVSGADLFTRMEYSQGGVEIDAAGDITLDAAGDDIKLKDNGTEFGKLRHVGSNQLGIYSNGILAVSFEDSDAVFNNDVNIENDLDVDRHLNVDGDTTLNGNVTLGNGTGDDITFTGQVASNIVPKTDNAYNLGSSGKEWKNGYFDGTVFADNLDGDSGTIANFNFKDNTISGTSGINLDATGDITLNAKGDDIVFEGTFNDVDSSRVVFDLGNNNSSVRQRIYNRHLVLEVDNNIYLDAGDGIVQFRDSANSLRMQVAYTTATGTEIDVTNGSLTFDVNGDIVLDANGGDILLKDNNVQFGRFQNNANNLRIWSADSVAATFTGKNVTMAGQITLPSADLDTTAKTVHGAINEVDSDLGERTSLSSFYDGHKEDIVTALNRVAARVIDIYDENGNLLNP